MRHTSSTETPISAAREALSGSTLLHTDYNPDNITTCGHAERAEVNAGKNILAAGQAVTADGPRR